jgi:hypothetical protein
MKQILIYFLAALFFSGCTSTPTKTQAELENVAFTDTDVFDKNLLDSMSSDIQRINVPMIGDVSLNRIPGRLGKWLSVVNKEGQLNFKQISREGDDPRITRGIPIAILGLLPAVYHFVKDQLTYSAAILYDATIFYYPNNGLIENVVFTKRKQPVQEGESFRSTD